MSKKNKFFFMDCSAAAICCDKAQYQEANFFEKIKLSFHLLLCKTCRKFSSRNRRLTDLMEDAKLKTCSEEQKKQWKENIKKEYSGQRTS
ncbi:hypothetical protein [Christiangramia aquimixticola]|uniref:hypothetical protein n=1 Tax=Christiangramia aquimixticola TaxID=1697558 RepID=UPI003AA9B26A